MGITSTLFGGSPQYGSAPTQSTTTYATSELPAEIRPAITDILEKGKAQFEGQTYQPYEGARVADFDPSQQQAFTGLQNLATTGLMANPALTGTGQYYQEAGNLLGDASAQMTQDDISRLSNPYTQNVTDIAKQKAQEQYESQTAQRLDDAAVGMGGMGSSRAGFVESQQLGDLNRQLSEIQTRGDQLAFQNAQQQFAAEKARQFQGAQGQQALGQGISSQAQQELGLLGQVGSERQGQAQTALDQAYGDFLEEKEFDTRKLQEYSSLVHGQGFQPSTYQTTTQSTPTPSVFEQLLGGATTAAGLYGAYGGFKNATGGQVRPYKSGGTIQGGAGMLETHNTNTISTRLPVSPIRRSRSLTPAEVRRNAYNQRIQAAQQGISGLYSPEAIAQRQASQKAAIAEGLLKDKASQEATQRQNMFMHLAKFGGDVTRGGFRKAVGSATDADGQKFMTAYGKAAADTRALEKAAALEEAGLANTAMAEELAGHKSLVDLEGKALASEEKAVQLGLEEDKVADQKLRTLNAGEIANLQSADKKAALRDQIAATSKDLQTRLAGANTQRERSEIFQATQKNADRNSQLYISELKNESAEAIAAGRADATIKAANAKADATAGKERAIDTAKFLNSYKNSLALRFNMTFEDGKIFSNGAPLKGETAAKVTTIMADWESKLYRMASTIRNKDKNMSGKEAVSKAVSVLQAQFSQAVAAGTITLK